jgi:LuxR family maltose regulon positive regulatory protein
MATSDICRVVNLSENTVKWYWSRIFAKLQVHRRFDAIKAARQQRLLA